MSTKKVFFLYRTFHDPKIYKQLKKTNYFADTDINYKQINQDLNLTWNLVDLTRQIFLATVINQKRYITDINSKHVSVFDKVGFVTNSKLVKIVKASH